MRSWREKEAGEVEPTFVCTTTEESWEVAESECGDLDILSSFTPIIRKSRPTTVPSIQREKEVGSESGNCNVALT